MPCETLLDWHPFFPETEPRPLQTEILDFITGYFDEADSFFIEAPPGVGKSAIAVCLARWYNARTRGDLLEPNLSRTYITTTTVNLEEQYMRSYRSGGLQQLHSAVHYACSRKDEKDNFLNCEQGRAIKKTIQGEPPKKKHEDPEEREREWEKFHRNLIACPGENGCPYATAKSHFLTFPYGILNAAYLLTETHYVGAMGKRGLLISDEGHSLCESICKFYNFELTSRQTAYLELDFPKIPDNEDEIFVFLTWLEEKYQPKLFARFEQLKRKLKKFEGGDPDDPELLDTLKHFKRVDAEVGKLMNMLNHVNNEGWVLERGSNSRKDFLSLTPISSKGIAEKILSRIAFKKVLLSATLIDFDYHRSELEIAPGRLKTFSAPSPFAVQHRPIYAVPSVKLDHRNLEQSCRQAAEVIALILRSHPNERGIIFVSSYPQAWAIKAEVNALLRDERLSTHENSDGKEILLRMHGYRNDSVIVSPSMHEGVDLKGDLSNFQIVTKLPFPSLGSKVVRKRKEAIPGWYAYTTALKLIQASGRSIRTEHDKAITYILDANFSWFYARNRALFPGYWQEAVTFL